MFTFDKENREILKRLKNELISRKEKFSGKAKGVHNSFANKIQAIEQTLAALRVKDPVRENLQNDCNEFIQLARKLEILQNSVEPLENEITELQSLFNKESVDIRSSFEQKRITWQACITSVWSCNNDLKLNAVQQTVETVKQEISRFKIAATAFQRADAVLKQISDETRTAALSLALEQARKKLSQSNLAEADIEHIEQLCEPLESLLRQPKSQEIGHIGNALTELRCWNECLEADSTNEQLFSRRKRTLEGQYADPNDLAELSKEVNAEIQLRVNKASEIRDEFYKKLRTRHLQLFKASTPDDNTIKQSAEKLKSLFEHNKPSSATEHKQWIDDYEDIEARFNPLVSHYSTTIKQKLTEQGASIEKEISHLKSSQLTQVLNRRVDNLQQKVFRLNEANEPQALLDAWQTFDTLINELEGIKQQFASDKRTLETTRQQLLIRFSDFDTEAKQMGFTEQTLNQEAFDALDSLNDMDKAINKIAELTQLLDGEEIRLKNFCLIQFSTIKTEINAIHQILSKAFDVLKQPCTLTALNLAIDESALYSVQKQQLLGIKSELELQAAQCINQFAVSIAGKQQQLKQLLNSSLHHHEQEEIKDLLQEDFDDPLSLAQLKRQTEKLRDIDRFLAERLEDIEKLTEKREKLKQRLRDILRTTTVQYPKERVERISDLLYGLPEILQNSHSVQVQHIDKLLGLLEQQVNRQIAENTRKNIYYLNANKHRLTDEDEQLLSEIEHYGHQQPLSADLRDRLVKTHKRIRRQ